MIKLKRFFLSKLKFFVLSLALFLVVVAQSQESRKYSNEFLNIGVGARGLAMSSAQVASSSDVNSAYWNPAGLTQITDNFQVALMHAEYFASIANYDYAAFAKPIDQGVIAFSFIRFGVDNILNTTNLIDNNGNVNYDNIELFSAADYAFGFSFARAMNDQLSLGATSKLIYRQIGTFANSWGFGIDAGAQYKLDHFNFGLMARDVTSTFNVWSITMDEETKENLENSNNELPENTIEITLPRFVFATSYSNMINDKISYLAEIDASISTDGRRNMPISGNLFSVDPYLGLEFSYDQLVFLRAGLGNLQTIQDFSADNFGNDKLSFQPNIGVGVKLFNISIDYALTDIGNVSDALFSNVFSLRYDFNKELN